MLIQRAALLDGGAVDIRVEDRIAEVADRLAPQRGEQVYDAGAGPSSPACTTTMSICARPPRP